MIINASQSYYWCWRCGLRFGISEQTGEVVCPKCFLHVATAGSKLWLADMAWCSSCNFFFGIVEIVGREPECPVCHNLPNGKQSISSLSKLFQQQSTAKGLLCCTHS